ncbi:uncharacterized protein LOC142214643 [Leptodactylus fuscus]|uniref:uncharacterized protein LOC142214643 n=1 Tax=Leptodactylus fuscus TaxID=238119 RepID=UPI003F4E80A8
MEEIWMAVEKILEETNIIVEEEEEEEEKIWNEVEKILEETNIIKEEEEEEEEKIWNKVEKILAETNIIKEEEEEEEKKIWIEVEKILAETNIIKEEEEEEKIWIEVEKILAETNIIKEEEEEEEEIWMAVEKILEETNIIVEEEEEEEKKIWIEVEKILEETNIIVEEEEEEEEIMRDVDNILELSTIMEEEEEEEAEKHLEEEEETEKHLDEEKEEEVSEQLEKANTSESTSRRSNRAPGQLSRSDIIYCARESGSRRIMRAQVLLLLIIIISAATSHCAAEVKPLVTLTPNWGTVLAYEAVTISCNAGSEAQENTRYYWSKNGELLFDHQQMMKIELASEENSGSYQCWTNEGLKSDPVRLDVIGRFLVLQAPPVIYIGDPLTLRCHSYSAYQKTNTTFFKNKSIIHFSVSEDQLHFSHVDRSMAGSYSCSQQIYKHKQYKTYSATTIVSVQERPHAPVSGNPLVLPWILVLAVLFLLAAALLIFLCRHQLRIRGRHQQHTITGPETKHNSEEDEVCYTYINVNQSQRAVPAKRLNSHDYCIVYATVTAPSAGGAVEGTGTSLTT